MIAWSPLSTLILGQKLVSHGDAKLVEIMYIAGGCDIFITCYLLVLTGIVLWRIRNGGNWLTIGAATFIGIAQLCNFALSVIIMTVGIDDKIWVTILSSIFSAGLLGLTEYVMWGFAYHYWVTSQNVEIVYHNMTVMYSDLP